MTAPLELSFSEKLATIQEKIESTRRKAVKLVVVSKTQSIQQMLAAYHLGVKVFGENYVQEAIQKKIALPPDIEWHFIGALQKNKANKCVEHFSWFHALSDAALAAKLEQEAKKQSKRLNVLIQMNMSREPSKNGLHNEEQLLALLETISSYQNLIPKGLMCIPDPTSSSQETEREYAALQKLQEKQQTKNPQFDQLSMGMSHDFEIALANGATIVRIGSALFGPRSRKG